MAKWCVLIGINGCYKNLMVGILLAFSINLGSKIFLKKNLRKILILAH
jgi:hypothetical protein